MRSPRPVHYLNDGGDYISGVAGHIVAEARVGHERIRGGEDRGLHRRRPTKVVAAVSQAVVHIPAGLQEVEQFVECRRVGAVVDGGGRARRLRHMDHVGFSERRRSDGDGRGVEQFRDAVEVHRTQVGDESVARLGGQPIQIADYMGLRRTMRCPGRVACERPRRPQFPRRLADGGAAVLNTEVARRKQRSGRRRGGCALEYEPRRKRGQVFHACHHHRSYPPVPFPASRSAFDRLRNACLRLAAQYTVPLFD